MSAGASLKDLMSFFACVSSLQNCWGFPFPAHRQDGWPYSCFSPDSYGCYFQFSLNVRVPLGSNFGYFLCLSLLPRGYFICLDVLNLDVYWWHLNMPLILLSDAWNILIMVSRKYLYKPLNLTTFHPLPMHFMTLTIMQLGNSELFLLSSSFLYLFCHLCLV